MVSDKFPPLQIEHGNGGTEAKTLELFKNKHSSNTSINEKTI